MNTEIRPSEEQVFRKVRECRRCGGPHDPEIHAATDRVRAWLRESLAAKLEPVQIGPKGSRVQSPCLNHVPQKVKKPGCRLCGDPIRARGLCSAHYVADWRGAREHERANPRREARP